MLKCILEKEDGKLLTEPICMRIGTNCWLLWTWQWASGFRRKRGISRSAEEVKCSQDGCFMKLACLGYWEKKYENNNKGSRYSDRDSNQVLRTWNKSPLLEFFNNFVQTVQVFQPLSFLINFVLSVKTLVLIFRLVFSCSVRNSSTHCCAP